MGYWGRHHQVTCDVILVESLTLTSNVSKNHWGWCFNGWLIGGLKGSGGFGIRIGVTPIHNNPFHKTKFRLRGSQMDVSLNGGTPQNTPK